MKIKKFSKEGCIQCGKTPCIKDTFLCSECFKQDRLFFEPRFELVNEKKLLDPDNLKKFNKSPYYLKRHVIAESIKAGKMI
ncbi:MAG: hypothetical protein ACFFAH_03290 [Promethearchaeota archaeon]